MCALHRAVFAPDQRGWRVRTLFKIGYFLTGFAIASIVGTMLRSSVAQAQSAPSPVIQPPPRAVAADGWARTTIRPAAPITEQSAEGFASPLPQPRLGRSMPGLGGGGPDARAVIILRDGDDPTRLSPDDGPRDGDPDPSPADGLIDNGREAVAAEIHDGFDMYGRESGDAAALSLPSEDFTRLPFQIELDPATDRRPARFARFEPFAPRGVRAGTWVMLPSIESGAGATNNAVRSPTRRSSLVFDAAPTLRAVTDWRQHAIDLTASARFSRFPDADEAGERAWNLEARGRLDITSRTSLEMMAARRRAADTSNTSFDPLTGRARRDVDTTDGAFALNHRFNRLSLQLRGSLSDVSYDQSVAADGTIIDNSERDFIRRELAARATWAFSPALATFAEYAVNEQDFRRLPIDGLSRDSRGDRFRVGFSFGTTQNVWRGGVAIGYGRQKPHTAAFQSASGIILDANLGWRISGLTSLLLTARSDFVTTTDAGLAIARQQRLGAELRHAFRRHLIGSAAVNWQYSAYVGGVVERETSAEIGSECWINQAMSVTGRYQHVWFDTSIAGANYQVDTVRLGFNWRP